MTLSRPPPMILSFGVDAAAAFADVSLAEPHAARVVPSARTAAAVCRTRVDFTRCAPWIGRAGTSGKRREYGGGQRPRPGGAGLGGRERRGGPAPRGETPGPEARA